MVNNPNTDYEKLVQDIYQTINSNESFKNINVQHNIKLKGKSGCEHQIDVYWEFTNMGEAHRVAIECKNYNKKVSIGKIRDFSSVLDDIGDIKGIFVTKVGYQKGAKEFADYHRITLKELRFPNESDWDGRVKDIIIDIIPYSKNITHREYHFNKLWCAENLEKNLYISTIVRNDYIKIINEDNEIIKTLLDLENELPVEFIGGEKQNVTKKYDFCDAYLLVPEYPKIKIDGITFTYDILTDQVRTVVEGEEIAKAILKDVKDGSIDFFWKNNNIL